MNARVATINFACAFLLWGCSPPGFKEQNLPLSSEPLKAYPALFSVDRAKMGFPPLPTNGSVRILTVDRKNWRLEYPPPNYDVSFQFYEGSTFYPYSSRFVALKRKDGEYKWVSEQVTFNGPKQHMVNEQLLNEYISIMCEIEQVGVQGKSIAGTLIIYSGPDKRLAVKGDSAEGLTVSQIGPILREWGYHYDLDRAQPNQ